MDRYIINKIQEAYLWFYDWTGVYLATVAISVFIIGKTIAGFRIDPVDWFFIIVNVGCMVPAYLDQDRNRIAVYNARALMLQGWWFRFAWTSLIFGFMVGEIFQRQYGNACYSFSLILFIYLSVICIREREPKEWFPQRKLAMVK